MATVQTLNDKDGNTFYPVTKTEAVYNADGTKTLDYMLGETEYKPGDTIDYRIYDIVFPGRQKITGTTKNIMTWVPLDKNIANGSTATFTPDGYIEAFDHTGTLFSLNNPDSSKITFSCNVPQAMPNMIRVTLTITDPNVTIHHNTPCVATLLGRFSIS